MQKNINNDKLQYIIDMTHQLSVMAKEEGFFDIYHALNIAVEIGKNIVYTECS
ncbi:hypothetical protein [Bartonella sp. DGB1]|uniref:hypothetical protein n=1 Tax=Bartonella sp. DGB1 TaxID=3239807 RepID=UPI003524BDF9